MVYNINVYNSINCLISTIRESQPIVPGTHSLSSSHVASNLADLLAERMLDLLLCLLVVLLVICLCLMNRIKLLLICRPEEFAELIDVHLLEVGERGHGILRA